MAKDKLDDLLLLERLAAGGMAEVYRAIQQGYGGFEKVVAVKRILPHFASDEEFKNMFVMEANLSGLLQHPNVVQIFSNGESEGYLYLVMEFVDGKNVRQLLARADKQKTRIPIEYGCFMIAEAAKGLEYAHAFIDDKTGQGMEIVHRDMSPQNIMLSYDGAIKIVDFGIAKAAARSEHTRAGVLKGKFGYMSPEQAQGMPIDRRTDIFALGIIFFELLTQRRLFSHDDDMRTLQLIRECNVPRPSKYNPSISPALDRIVLKALAKNRNDRYATASDLYADLQRFLNQKYPQFLPMEFAKFLREKVFKEDISTERKKREQLAAEAPAKLGSPGSRKHSEALKKKEDRDKDSTQIDFEDEVSRITQASEIREIGVGLIHEEDDISLPVKLDLPKSAARAAAPRRDAAPKKEIKIEVSEIEESASSELDPPGAFAAEKTRITKSEVLMNPEMQAAAKVQSPQLNESDENAAFPIGSGPSHLSLSVQMGNDGGPGAGKRGAPGQSPIDAPAMRGPSARKIAKATPKLEDMDEKPYVKIGDRKVAFAEKNSPPSLFRSRIFIFVMVAAGLGAYYHYENSEPSIQIADNTDAVKAESKVATTRPVEPKAETRQVAQTEDSESQGRTPASAGLDAQAYVPQGATGYVNVKSFPSATKIYIDGQILVDNEGAPVRAPANLQRVAVGTQRIRLENSALGVSWEGEIKVEFDSVKKLEVRLK